MNKNITVQSTNGTSNVTQNGLSQSEMQAIVNASATTSQVVSKPITFKSLVTAKVEKPKAVEPDSVGKDLQSRIQSFMSRELAAYADFTRLASDGQSLVADCELVVTAFEKVSLNLEFKLFTYMVKQTPVLVEKGYPFNPGYVATIKGFLSGNLQVKGLNGKKLDPADIRVASYVILASDKLARIQVLDGKFEQEAKQFTLQAEGYASLTQKAIKHGESMVKAVKEESSYSKITAKTSTILKEIEAKERAENAHTKLCEALLKSFCSETGIPLTNRDYRVTTYFLGSDDKLKANNPRLVSREVVNKLREDGVLGLGIVQIVTERAIVENEVGKVEKITYSTDNEYGDLVRIKRENYTSAV